MINVPTNLNFHSIMRKIVQSTDMYGADYSEVYEPLNKIMTAEEIINYFQVNVDYDMSEDIIELFEDNRREYFKLVAQEISLELSKKVSGKEDELMEGIKIPFYLDVIKGRKFMKIEDNVLYVKSITYSDTIKEDDVYISRECFDVYKCYVKDGMVTSYVSDKEYLDINRDELKKYSVSYEYFSSWLVDTGSSKTVWAKNPDEAISVCAMISSGPDENMSWSFSVMDDDGNFYDDDSSCSYLNAIERPGIAAAEAASHQKEVCLAF